MRVTECGSFVPAFCISFNKNITHANILNGGRRGKLLLARAVLLQSVTIRRLTGNDVLAAISIIVILGCSVFHVIYNTSHNRIS